MMTLPKSNRALWQVFKNGRVPLVKEFQGEYLVRMLTNIPSLHRIKHRKSFKATEQGVIGKNILFRNFEWGNFFLEEGDIDKPESLKMVVINYATGQNTFLTRRIRDFVRAVDGKRLYLGRFNIVVLGKPVFLGYFSLTKIEQS